MIDGVLRERRGITVSTLDIRAENAVRVAGEVWQHCRSGAWDAQAFGDSLTDRGMPPIRYALLHDFAALAKIELLGCDDWVDLIQKPEADLTAGDLAFLDRVAAATTSAGQPPEALRAMFDSSAYGQAALAHLAGGDPS